MCSKNLKSHRINSNHMPMTVAAGVQNVMKERRSARKSSTSAWSFAWRSAINNDWIPELHRWMEVFAARSETGSASPASVSGATWEPTSAENKMEPLSSHPTDYLNQASKYLCSMKQLSIYSSNLYLHKIIYLRLCIRNWTFQFLRYEVYMLKKIFHQTK